MTNPTMKALAGNTALTLVLALPLALPFALGMPAAWAQSDAGTPQALADDNAPTDADADASAGADAGQDDGSETMSASREGTEACVDILARIEGDFNARAEEAQAALATMAAADPLVLRMKDGSTIDLRPADTEGGPVENWFGDPPRRTAVSASIDQMRAFGDAGNEAECLDAARAITASLNEWEGIEPVGEMAPASETDDAAAAEPMAVEGATDEAAVEGAADPTTVTTADGETVDLSADEAAEVTATADDTGEGDDYGAPAATEQAEVTGEDTEGVETAVETDPAMGTTVEGDDVTDTAALTDDASDDRTQEGAGAETPLAPLTRSDEENDAGTTGEGVVVGAETLDGDAAGAAEATSEQPRTRMVERPGRIIIEDGAGNEVDPSRQGVQFRTVPIE